MIMLSTPLFGQLSIGEIGTSIMRPMWDATLKMNLVEIIIIAMIIATIVQTAMITAMEVGNDRHHPCQSQQ